MQRVGHCWSIDCATGQSDQCMCAERDQSPFSEKCIDLHRGATGAAVRSEAGFCRGTLKVIYLKEERDCLTQRRALRPLTSFQALLTMSGSGHMFHQSKIMRREGHGSDGGKMFKC